MSDFTDLVDLAAERLGASAVATNDDFFASKDNLLKASAPIFIEGKYTDRGKWMDGWESRRRRTPGHDWCIVRLGLPGMVRGVVVDTAFFRGNFPESCSLEACSVSGHPDADQLTSPATVWTEILPKSCLEGDTQNRFVIDAPQRFTHLRLNIHPDGGVARLRAYGDVVPEIRWLGRPGAEVDLASVENGALVIACNDMFFGSRHNLIMPGRGVNMGDGWETKRSRGKGPDWVLLALAAEGTIERIEVDTLHFKGNAPESCAVSVIHAPGATVADLMRKDAEWTEVLARTKLEPHTRHYFDADVRVHPAATHVRFRIWPDGGVSRLRLLGTVTREGREAFGVRRLNLLAPADAERDFRSCCGSAAWAQRMAMGRPFENLAEMRIANAEVWAKLTPEDWQEAFRAHPRIGEKKADSTADASPMSRRWAEDEQSEASSATRATLDALGEVNKKYEAKFGHIYIVCATGKSAEEMLALAEQRLGNDPASELGNAGDEQRKITDIRLHKLVHG